MTNEKRLIDANALKDNFIFLRKMWSNTEIFMAIDEQPTVDAVEVVHGRWEKAHIAGFLKCNCCKDAFIYEEWLADGKWNYCPNCGAKMDGDGNA